MSFSEELDRQRRRSCARRHASDGWAEAMRAHKLAPPDPGLHSAFTPVRAAGAEQVAWNTPRRRTSVAAGARAENAARPTSFGRHRSPRTGPLWERFDARSRD